MTMPSCPRCGSNEHVEALAPPRQIGRDPLLEAESPWPYLCAEPCDMTFTGTGDEWERMRWVRAEFAAGDAS